MITLENVSKAYGQHVALASTTLAFAARRTTALIGPSGCGKSTLLRLIVGLIRPNSGRVLVDGEALGRDNLNRVRHRIGYVIQDGGLFPHLTAGQNVMLLARHLQRPAEWISSRVRQLVDLMRMPAGLLERFPGDLSGGQRQRVSLMRALMLDPPILLMDEPFGALDPITRFELQEELKRIFAELHKTVVLVTHDMNEAAHFGDSIVLLREGRVVQAGTLEDLLRRPAEDYVRDFVRAQRTTLPPEAQ
ncbi:MAG: ATP-binding cassette domain-containing protein [Betaproteobacteria bacterium]|nr:ATP-binding cassette domain-containing protein [Betaproteobacteria bacterium]